MKKQDSEKEEYELLPHKELEELKNELRNLKEFELTPSKKMEISVIDLNKKLDILIEIFEKASRDLRFEEGGLSFKDKMRPFYEKMNKILEQNAEIASGILAVADLLKGDSEQEKRLPDLMPPPGLPPQGMPLPPGFPHQGIPQPPRNLPPQGISHPPNTMPPLGNPSLPPKQFQPTAHFSPQQNPAVRIPVKPGINIRPALPNPEKKRTFGF